MKAFYGIFDEMWASGKIPTDWMRVVWIEIEKCYELQHNKLITFLRTVSYSTSDHFIFGSQCHIFVGPGIWDKVYRGFTSLWEFVWAQKASKLGSAPPHVRIPLLDKKVKDVKYVCCPSPSCLLFEKYQKWLSGDADSVRYPASLTSWLVKM